MYIPRNWEFGQAFSKLRNFGGEVEPPKHPPPLGTPVFNYRQPKTAANYHRKSLEILMITLKRCFRNPILNFYMLNH
jgi:hypothetical protein